MKKVALILMVLVSNVVLLTGCTDQAEELQERIELESNIELNSGTKVYLEDDKDEEPERD